MTKAGLARKAGLAPQVISDLCGNRRKAGKKMAQKIKEATNGEIGFRKLRPDFSKVL